MALFYMQYYLITITEKKPLENIDPYYGVSDITM